MKVAARGVIFGIGACLIYGYLTYWGPEWSKKREGDRYNEQLKEDRAGARAKLEGEFESLAGPRNSSLTEGGRLLVPPALWLDQLLDRPDLWKIAQEKLAAVDVLPPASERAINETQRKRLDEWQGNLLLRGQLKSLIAPQKSVVELLERLKIPLNEGCGYERHRMIDLDGDGTPDVALWLDCRKNWSEAAKWDTWPALTLEVYLIKQDGPRLVGEYQNVDLDFESGHHRGPGRFQFLVRDEGCFYIYERGPKETRLSLKYCHSSSGRQGLRFETKWSAADKGGIDELLVAQKRPVSKISHYRFDENGTLREVGSEGEHE